MRTDPREQPFDPSPDHPVPTDFTRELEPYLTDPELRQELRELEPGAEVREEDRSVQGEF